MNTTPKTCGWDDKPAAAMIRWTDPGSGTVQLAPVCEAHRRSIASDPQGTEILPLA